MWYPYQAISENPAVPLAPILKVALLSPMQDNTRVYELDALLDTGSDVTLIPLEAISVLRLSILADRVPIVGVGGGTTIGFPCRVNLQFGERTFSLTKVVGCEAAAIGVKGQMIIGRDILNQFCIKFDGKRQRFSFE